MLLFLLACGDTPTPKTTTPTTTVQTTSSPEDVVLHIYSGRSESLVASLFEEAEKDLGIKFKIEYGKTDQLVTRMLTEGTQSPADIIFAQDSGHLGALSNRDMLEELPQSLYDGIQAQYRDDKKRWLATSGRLRVLVYNSTIYQPQDLPQTLYELSDPKWKGKLGWAPSNGSFLAHVSALRALWGEEKTEAWLKAMKDNLPGVYPKNSPQVKAVDEGTLDIGWVNHYYLHRLDKKQTTARNYMFKQAGDAGNILMLSGVGIRKGSKQKESAQKLLQWMISDKAQRWFTQNNFEYPTIDGIKTHPDVQPIPKGQLADIQQSSLADIGPTRSLLKKVGL